MNRRIIRAAAAMAMLGLAMSCGGGGGGSPSTPPPVVVPPTSTQLDVTPCFLQMVDGRTVASLVLPDVITLDTSRPAGFPNGRMPDDPVVDLELAALFLDLRTTPIDALVKRPLNPDFPDHPMLTSFPWLANANGGVPVSSGGSGFVFRTEPASAYTRVDRMGEPAVATVLIVSSKKTAFNDDSVTTDPAIRDLPIFSEGLEVLAEEIVDDFQALGYKTCAVPKT